MPEAAENGNPETTEAEVLTLRERAGIVEAILFVTGNAVPTEDIAKALGLSEEELDETLSALESACDYEQRGVRLLRYGKHVQLSTRPEYASYVERLLQPVQQQTLSQAIMETLAVIAYRQPATKGEIEQIRGVKCDYSVQSLLNKGLIEEQGRLETLGRPILYGTTDAFLRHFGISSLEELPEIDFNRLADKLSSDADSDAEEGQKTLGDGETAVQP
ncbi:MAG: SMC-Scp complex subunit ScpB [Clostridiales bacterium]|nr:SMC-Scp complex subunit ScpB [Clostridiales bacterium]